jgi:hypothetical protein
MKQLLVVIAFAWSVAGVQGASFTAPSGSGGSATNAITSINSDTTLTQTITTGSTGTDVGVATSSGTHTIALPSAGAAVRGVLSSNDWGLFVGKQNSNGMLTILTTMYATGTGSPESAVSARVGAIYACTNTCTGSGLYVKTNGTGTTGWWQIQDTVGVGGSGGTNFPPAIYLGSGTNVTLGVGVRQFVTTAKGATFGINWIGTPLGGETVRLGVSNTAASTIYMTNYAASVIADCFDPYVASNVTAFAIAATSTRFFDFAWHSNFSGGTIRQELHWSSEKQQELAVASAGGNGFLALSTNAAGSIVTISNAYIPQASSMVLSNIVGLSSTVFTNVPLGGTNISVRTSGGTNFIDTIGELNNWSSYPTNVWNSRQGGSATLTNLAGTGAITNRPTILTNSIWISAGAFAPYGGSALEGGRNGATIGSYTNAGSTYDLWDFDDTTNEAVTVTWAPRGFAGDVLADIHWMTTNTLNGASNVVWQIAVSQMVSNNLFGTFSYFTNSTVRFWSSNSLQIARLPLISVTNLSPAELLTLRISRMGTDAGDTAAGDTRLLGARISFTHTNYLGGY